MKLLSGKTGKAKPGSKAGQGRISGYRPASSIGVAARLQEISKPGQCLVLGDIGLLATGGRVTEILLVRITGMLVVMAVKAQQLPIGAILGVVVVVVIAVMHSQLADTLAAELPGATATDPGVHLQRLLAIAFLQLSPAVLCHWSMSRHADPLSRRADAAHAGSIALAPGAVTEVNGVTLAPGQRKPATRMWPVELCAVLW